MEELVNKLSKELVSKLLSGFPKTLKAFGKPKEDWEYPDNTETLGLFKRKYPENSSDAESEKDFIRNIDVKLLQDLDIISEYLESTYDSRSAIWIVNPKKLEALRDVQLHYKIKRSLNIIQKEKK